MVFDTVSRYSLWRIMVKYSCPQKFITIIRQFLDCMHVQDNGESSVAFPVTNGTKQGCVLTPTHFISCFLWCCLMHLMPQIMELRSNTALVALSSTSEGFKQRPRWKLILSMSFYLLTTVHWVWLPTPTCKTVLTSSQWPVTKIELSFLPLSFMTVKRGQLINSI